MQTSLIGKYLKVDDKPSKEIVGVAYDSSDDEISLFVFLLRDCKTKILSQYILVGRDGEEVRVLNSEQRSAEETL